MSKDNHDIKAYIASLEHYKLTATLQLINPYGIPLYKDGQNIEITIARDPDELLTTAIANEIRERIAGKDTYLVYLKHWGTNLESIWTWPAMYSEYLEAPTWRLEVIAELIED